MVEDWGEYVESWTGLEIGLSSAVSLEIVTANFYLLRTTLFTVSPASACGYID